MLGGPTGAGKSTVLRMLVGLVKPSAGTAVFGGQRYADLHDPACLVGAALEPFAGHPGHTGRDHLRVVATAVGVPPDRIDSVITLAGLDRLADRKVRGWPLDWLQRLNFATAMLGDPAVLIVDDVGVGMDGAGLAWLHGELACLARQGRAILVASRTPDDLVGLDHDLVRLRHDQPAAELSRQTAATRERGAETQ